MAISRDANAEGGSNSTSSVTFSHTCTGSNLILFVGVRCSQSVSSVTYNGVSLTNINTSAGAGSAGGQKASLWYLLNPAVGAHNVVITPASSGIVWGASSSYTGVKQSGQPDSNNTNADPGPGNVTSLSQSTTVVGSNCWVVMFGLNDNGQTLSAGTGSNLVSSGNNGASVFDSNGTVSTGAYSMAYSGGSAHYAMAMASFLPAATANGNFLAFM